MIIKICIYIFVWDPIHVVYMWSHDTGVVSTESGTNPIEPSRLYVNLSA